MRLLIKHIYLKYFDGNITGSILSNITDLKISIILLYYSV